MFRIISCFISLFVCAAAIGQGHESLMNFDHLTIEDRLSHNSVYCLIQDQNGYIWAGTQDGLNKYDGYTFEIYRTNQSAKVNKGFVGKTISSLLEDRAGNIWVGTRKHGINFLPSHHDQFVNLSADPAFESIAGFAISALYEDQKGNIWIATVGAGLLSFDPQSRTSTLYNVENSGLSSNLVFDIVEDAKGNIWVAASGLSLNFLEKRGQFSQLPQETWDQANMAGYRKTLLLDGDELWFGTEGSGLYKVNIEDKSYVHFAHESGRHKLSSNGIRDLQLSKDGLLLIATDGGGLNVYDEKADTLYSYTSQPREVNSLNSNALQCIIEDRAGNIWLGTFNGGINLYKADKTWFEFLFPEFPQQEEIKRRSVLGLTQGTDGQIWVGTDGGGLFLLNPQDNHFSRLRLKNNSELEQKLQELVVKTIFEDSQGRFWFGTFREGLLRYDPKRQTTHWYRHEYGNPHSLGGNNVWSIAEGKDGRLWIGTIGGGLSIYDPGRDDFRVFMPNEDQEGSIADNHIMMVFIDKEEQIWVGTGDHGLDRWNEEREEFEHFVFNPEDSLSISNDEIRTIFQDSRGELWIGTEGGGLNRWLGDGQFERLNKQSGLIGDNVMDISEDLEANLWISAFEGISVFNPENRAIRNFDFRGGVNSNQFNQLASICASDGRLYFGGIRGINTILPEQVKSLETDLEIIFTDFKVFNQSVAVGRLSDGRIILENPIEQVEEIHLDYTDNSFSLFFATTDFVHPAENQFQYKMDGFDPNWQNTSLGQNSVTYTNLTPGTYTFFLRYHDKELSKKIRIQPPFWQTIWFRALLFFTIIALIAGVFIFIIQRREALLKQQMLEANSEILQLRNEKLASDLEGKNAKLMFSAVQMAHKNEILSKVKKEIKALDVTTQSQVRQMLRRLDRELKSEDYWSEFNLYFNEVDKDFLQALKAAHPELTQNDLRVCSLIRINLTTKEIASLLNITVRGVEQSRYRLKKRLGLESEDNLADYITHFKGKE
ncbi:MAG: two-component regulator propeller domain-containing protein [Bacteroidia bacterium]|nr:two-component regulator propeller domain-containing protein [Bacteroidia bacterium]